MPEVEMTAKNHDQPTSTKFEQTELKADLGAGGKDFDHVFDATNLEHDFDNHD